MQTQKWKSVGTLLPMSKWSDLSDYRSDASLIVLRSGKPVDIIQNNQRVSGGKWRPKQKLLQKMRKGY